MTGFHLGGGVGGGTESPLFVFKHRYDPASEPRAFHVAKLVHDPTRYRELAGTDSTIFNGPPESSENACAPEAPGRYVTRPSNFPSSRGVSSTVKNTRNEFTAPPD